MKKYDLSIIGAYVVIITIVSICMRLIYNDITDGQAEVMNTLSMEVDSIVIKNYDKEVSVVRTDVTTVLKNGNWGVMTQLYQSGTKFFKIEDKVLRIGSPDHEPISGIKFITLYIDSDMPIAVINSPNITFGTMMGTTTATYHDKNGNEIEVPSKAKK